MKTIPGILAIVAALVLVTTPAHAQTTTFTYQGFLTESGGPANGASDFEFKLYNDTSAGTQQGGTVTLDDVGVTNGLFTVMLDFGAGVFDGSGRWLDIAVRPAASASAYTNLIPRQAITASPYAVRALNLASNALAGFSGAVSLSNPANTFTGTFSGDG